ncbi:LacI family transcriptional regulator [Solihabitans fulvus]|uniref:LacI family transcriptional regulator n=2 Tax=Solihabitans fulvus TaxID=1892852 RepID=A0A5B2XDU9_9PSEU|nr:LacI family transcriptional regulator [Solihabitans fulvus]
MTGVSQATVSMVLNNRDDGEIRIPQETRDRVLAAIQSTGYVANPIARSLISQDNRIFGVFTYESVFPSEDLDFYHPFLAGIERRAEQLGYDLVLFTSSPVVDGGRKIFHAGSRLRLADGCVVLGRRVDRAELARLVAEGFPFVSVGRRDDVAAGPVAAVGADYVSAVAELVRRTGGLGHRTVAFVGEGAGPESSADRWAGFAAGVADAGVRSVRLRAKGRDAGEVLDSLVEHGATAMFVEDPDDTAALVEECGRRGVRIPEDVSLVELGGSPPRTARATPDFTGFRIPREEMGAQAVDLLARILGGDRGPRTRLLPCRIVAGATLAAPRSTP